MIYIIIGLVLLLIAAPIIAVLPSKREKEQMKLRQQAMAQGISVELTSIDDPIPKQKKYVTGTGKQLKAVLQVAAYRIVRQQDRDWRREPEANWSLERRAVAQDIELPGTWCWLDDKPDNLTPEFIRYLTDKMSHLPEDVVRIEEVNRVISVYWHERSEEAGLQSIVEFLTGCLAIKPITDVSDQ